LLQLARTYARLAQPHLLDQRTDRTIPSGLPQFAVAALVVSLTADAEVTAGLANA